MIPSHLISVALLKNSSTVSESCDVASMLFTQVNWFGTSVNRPRRSSRLSRNGRSSSDSPFRYMRSNENKQTSTLTLPIATSFRARFASVWNVFRSPESRSTATTSPSMIKLETPSPRILGIKATRSGYLSVMSSR